MCDFICEYNSLWIILIHTVGACSMLSHTPSGVSRVCTWGHTEGEGKTPLWAAGKSSAGVPSQVSSGLSLLCSNGEDEEKDDFSCMLPHYLLYAFFPNRINPNSLFVAWLRLSTVIREIVAHWPLTSCTHVLLANISVFKIPFNSMECTSTALLFQLSPTQASTSKTRYEKVGGKGWLSHQW